MKNLITALVILASPSAFATGGFSCIADNATLKFEIGATTSRGLGSGIVSADAKMEFKETDGQPKIAKFELNKEDIKQYWNTGDNFNLLLYTEAYEAGPNDDYFFETYVIETKAIEPQGWEFKGTLKTHSSQTVKGETREFSSESPIDCWIE